MTLTLLPAIDVRNGKAVRLRRGESGTETDYGTPLDAAAQWADQGATWIHLVDLDAAFDTGDNRDIVTQIVRNFGDRVHIEVSGGIRNTAALEGMLEAGASRVNIGTAAMEQPEWTASMLAQYAERVAIGLDVKGHTVASHGWVKDAGNLFDALDFFNNAGCTRYVVTDVARDGMLSGPNLELLAEVARHTDAHVTASGGIATLEDLEHLKELVPLGVDAAILGKSLYSGAFTLREALEVSR